MILFPVLGKQPFRLDSGQEQPQIPVLEHLFQWPFYLRVFRNLRQQIDLLRNLLHQLAPVAVDEQVHLHLGIIQSPQEPDKAPLGAAEFEVMDGEKDGFQDARVCLILLSAWKTVRKKLIFG